MLAGARHGRLFVAGCPVLLPPCLDDRIGLTLARLIVSRLLDTDAAIEVVVDDTLL